MADEAGPRIVDEWSTGDPNDTTDFMRWRLVSSTAALYLEYKWMSDRWYPTWQHWPQELSRLRHETVVLGVRLAELKEKLNRKETEHGG